MNDSDSVLWDRVRDGDRAAFTFLFDRHEQRLFRHASRLLSIREDAKDAVAIAFLELWRKRRSVRLVDGSPLPWMLNTVTNTARNLERAGRRYRRVLARVDGAETYGEIRVADESGVLAAVSALPPRDRAVLVLSVLEGYSEKEIAQALGVAPGTVKSRLFRAKARLRAVMDVSHRQMVEGVSR